MSILGNESEEFKQLRKDLWDKITDGAQYIQNNNLGKCLPITGLSQEQAKQELSNLIADYKEPSSDIDIYEQIIKISESIPYVEPTQSLIMGGVLFSVLKSSRDFLYEVKTGMSASITGTIGNITIVCDGFIKNDDPNIYQFKDGKLTIVAMVEGLDNIY